MTTEASGMAAPLKGALDSRLFMAVGYAVAVGLTAAAAMLGSSPTLAGPLGPASPVVLTLLGLGLVVILAVGAMMAWRVVRLFNAQSSDAGARLHLRFIGQFALAAVAPAVIVALFFGVLVTRGVENWFNARVQNVVENSATVARSYLQEQQDFISDHVALMARDLNNVAYSLSDSPVAFSHFLRQEASDNGFAAAYLMDRQGRVLARAEPSDAPPLLTPPEDSFKAADDGDVTLRAFETLDLYASLYRLRAYPDAYLYVLRPVDRGVFNHLREAEASLAAYREAAKSRARIQAAFALNYVEMALLVLVGAVWLGMTAAGGIAGPVARLVQAAGRVSAGDLTVRVDASHDPEEIAVLSRAFNTMTGDLQAQQAALRAAHIDAESKSHFMETVLLGVSAGVIGLDPNGRVSAVNRQATLLLGVTTAQAFGRSLSQIAPELVPVAERAGELNGEAEEDVDLVRSGESLRLRVRAGHSAEGLVLTFDDITRLVAAQRNAAWKDVARRIAHEIKNPLTPIQLSAERLRRKYRKEISQDLETFDRCTDTIIRQVGDIGRMVDEFSAFARMPAPKFADHDAPELLREAVFAQRVAAPDVTFDIVEPVPASTLVCDGRIVGQALTNVLKNAAEAVHARHAADPDAPRGHITARLVLTDSQLDFVVEDNGVGLPAKDRDRLTEPYVTTREKGTGLGLAIVKRILEDHGGSLILTDAEARPGARIVLSFPHTPRRDRAAASDAVNA
ncbi:MAG TPA: PAS domain-containing sensor histidine kinase [Caulobacteraceae bacterium]|nr:PAS domain-containing sensor histidine kinase [Caulobacteraceae bacterium]